MQQQDTITRSIDSEQPEQPASMTLLVVQCQVGICRGTLKTDLSYLRIEPLCWHIDTCRFSISHVAMAQVKHLQPHPASLLHRSSLGLLPGRAERDGASDGQRKDVFDGC